MIGIATLLSTGYRSSFKLDSIHAAAAIGMIFGVTGIVASDASRKTAKGNLRFMRSYRSTMIAGFVFSNVSNYGSVVVKNDATPVAARRLQTTAATTNVTVVGGINTCERATRTRDREHPRSTHGTCTWQCTQHPHHLAHAHTRTSRAPVMSRTHAHPCDLAVISWSSPGRLAAVPSRSSLA